MTQIATVEKTLPGGRAEISVARQSACTHACSECVGCGRATAAPVRAVADNPIGAQSGQKVVVESATRQVLGVVLLVYVFPVALFFLGYFAFPLQTESARALAAVCAFFLGVIPAVLYDRRVRRGGGMHFTIVRLF